MGWYSENAVPPIKKKEKRENSLHIRFSDFFFIELNYLFVSFLNFILNLQLFGKLELQAKTVSAAL